MLRNNVIANYTGQLWTAVMSIVFVPVYIKFLGIEAYGLVGLFSSLLIWLHLLDMGLAPTLNREMSRFSEGAQADISIINLLRSVEIISLGLGLLVFITILSSTDWLANFWIKSSEISAGVVASSLSIMGFVASLRFLEGIYKSCMLGLQRQVLLNVIVTCLSTLRGLGAALVIIYISPTIIAFFVWQAIVSILSVLIFSIVTYRSLPFTWTEGRFSLPELKRVSRFTSGIIGLTFLSVFVSQFDKLILSGLVGLDEYGYYTLATLLAGTLYMTASPITQAFYPQMCGLFAIKETKKIEDIYHIGSQMITLVSGTVALMLFFYADLMLFLWTGDRELADKVAPLLSILAVGNLLSILNYMPHHLQLASGWTSLAFRLNLFGCFLIVPTILVLTPMFGGIAAALTWLGFTLLYLPASVFFMNKKILRGVHTRWFIYDVLIPLCGGLAAIVLTKVTLSFDGSIISQFSLLFLSGVLTLSVSAVLTPIGRKKAALMFTL
mgnify:CR=1 FL=1